MICIDELIIKKVLNGDVNAFTYIVKKYENLVYTICLNIVGDSFKSQDLTQDTFISLYKALPQVHGNNLKNYICRIATNKSIDYKRSAVRTREFIADFEDYSQEEFKSEGFEKLILDREKKQQVITLVNSLNEPYRSTVISHYFKGKSYNEMAKEENISIKTVETRLYRARKILFDKINESGVL